MLIKSVYFETSIRKFSCSFLSSSLSPALDFTEKLSQDPFILLESSFIISNVSGLCFNISLPHQHFITVLEGHQVLSSIQEKLSQKFSIRRDVALMRFSFLHQKS
jgi:hypothetical protein